MRSKALIFLTGALFLSACGYQLPETPKNTGNSAAQTNQNAANQPNAPQTNQNAVAANAATPIASKDDAANTGGAKLTLSGISETRSIPCNGREIEVEEPATASNYTLTGECKKLIVDGVSNQVRVEKVGEIVVRGISNKVTYGEGVGGKKPKISKSGTDTSVEPIKPQEKSAGANKT